MTAISWGRKSIDDTVKSLNTSVAEGLSSSEVVIRQQKYNNTLQTENHIKPGLILLSQFTDTMVLVLLVATVISGIVGAMADAITIMAIVFINAVLGFIQEYRAEKSLEEIKKLTTPYASVLRAGKRTKIPSKDLVPGDIVFLETGDKVPADLRLIEALNLEIDEALLTGESVPVEKDASVLLAEDCLLADHRNMACMGTAVTKGRGKAVVVNTGMETVMGKIAELMKDVRKTVTPLQSRLDQLGKILIVICITVCFIVTLMGIYRGEPVMDMLMAGISLAVAAIPEGLPAIVTIVLALGVQRMAKSNAIVRKLPAVETLGCTTVICSDKTGTLTQNKMTVKKLATLNKIMDIEGEGYEPVGKFKINNEEIDPKADTATRLILEVALNCNNSILQKGNRGYETQGDPTEISLLAMAIKAGMPTAGRKRLLEIPFDSRRKKMSCVVEIEGELFVLVKGAFDVIVDSCAWIINHQKKTKLEPSHVSCLQELQEKWANQALRVLGFAYKPISPQEVTTFNEKQLESNLVMLGICGIIDPPRRGVASSVNECLQAGIIPIMITGDHPATARAIAAEIGITRSGEVISGNEINKLTDEQLYSRAVNLRVFARVSPEHKNRIVKILQKHNHVVAMTGDGVNDAPAVKAADIGVAMGITGTEVTKEASSMILMDDDFSTIVRAVHEGRAIYDNIRKFIRYLLGGNIGEVMVMFTSYLLGMPLPLLPIQILWINLVTDGLPAMGLGLEPPEPGIMHRKPRPKNEGIFARRLGWIVFSRGFFIAAVTLISFTIGLIYVRLEPEITINTARTMAFTTLVFAQLFYVFECRSEKYSPFELGILENKYLLIAVSCSVIMHLSVIYIPALQAVFKTVPLELWQWSLILVLTGGRLLFRYFLFLWQRFIIPGNVYDKING